jgi:hypothetical protein
MSSTNTKAEKNTKSEKSNKGTATIKSTNTKAVTYSPSATSSNILTMSMNLINQSSKKQSQTTINSTTNKPSTTTQPTNSYPQESIKNSMSTSTSASYSPSVTSSNAGNQSTSFMEQVSSYKTEAIANSSANNQANKATITTAIIAAVNTIEVKNSKNNEKKDTPPQVITRGSYSPSQLDPNQSLSYFEQNTYNSKTPLNEKQRYYNNDKTVVKDYSWNHINNLLTYQKERSEESKKVTGNNNKLFTWNLKKQIDNIHRNDIINNKVKAYTNYWNRTDGYFDGFWWQDDTKINEATSMLELEIDVKGSISMINLKREREMLAIQELANAERTRYYDEGTLAALENNLTVKGLDYTEKNHSIDKETLEALKERHDKVIFNKAGDVLEGGLGDVISGLSLLGLGAVATISNNSKTSGNGNIEKTNSTEKNTKQAAEEPVNTEIKTEDDITNGNIKSVDNGIEGGSNTSKLDWDSVVSKKGETRVDHINNHGADNLGRDTHTVFNDDPITTTNKAWENKGNTSPIDDGMGGEIYNIPYKNSGYEGGAKGSGGNLDYVTIVVEKGTNNIITAFPSSGTYGIK